MSQECPRGGNGLGLGRTVAPSQALYGLSLLGLLGWGAPGKVEVHACGLALTLGEALLRLLPFEVLLGMLLGVLLGGLIVGCATDGGVPVEGLRRLLQGHMVT